MRSERMEADYPFPQMVVHPAPGVDEVVPNWAAVARLRRRSMSWVRVMASLREDYGVVVRNDDRGNVFVEPPHHGR